MYCLLIYWHICSGRNFVLVKKLRVCFKKSRGIWKGYVIYFAAVNSAETQKGDPNDAKRKDRYGKMYELSRMCWSVPWRSFPTSERYARPCSQRKMHWVWSLYQYLSGRCYQCCNALKEQSESIPCPFDIQCISRGCVLEIFHYPLPATPSINCPDYSAFTYSWAIFKCLG